ncbi:MAG TPA: ABC transporter ATP-binding protein [Solirubrobacteraceae bacterium]|nr:ABC transporter ATP-binding protein [Solirubrobacteraceae bacterium]
MHSEPASPSTARARLSLLLGDRRGAVAMLAGSSILSGFAEAGMLVLLTQIAAAIATGARHVHTHVGPLRLHTTVGELLLVALALTAFRLVLQVPISILPARIGAEVQARLRRDLLHAFTRASWSVQSADREGHLQETMTSQVIQATSGAVQATTLLTSMITFVVLLASALVLNVIAAAIVLTVAIALFGLLRPLSALGARRARSLSQAQMEYAGGIGEAIRVAEDTQVFGVAAAQRERIGRLIDAARELFFRTWVIGRLVPNLYQSIIYLLIVVGLGGLYLAGAGHAASLGAVVLLLVRAGNNGQQAQTSYQGLRQSLPFIERLQAAEARYAQSAPLDGGALLPRIGSLAFERVSFAYRAERPVLCEISFAVAGGEAIGIVGPSGAGKSTLVQILLRLRPLDRGRYLVNGVPAEQFARSEWNRRVAYVSQEPRLVHATVAENIRYFRDLSREAIERAGRLARIHDEVIAWPQGYDTVVGPRADAVSGGQQQRICLARALAARPEVLVLDEPTSALDPTSERLIQESLTALKHELTLFIVAHRLSTLDICDRVMVIVDGRLAAFDTTAFLQRHSPYYRTASGLAASAPAGLLVAR